MKSMKELSPRLGVDDDYLLCSNKVFLQLTAVSHHIPLCDMRLMPRAFNVEFILRSVIHLIKESST